MKIERLTILGGGTSGWMVAAAFSKKYPDLNITLIESEDIGTVGVGESTIPPIRNFNQFLGINEFDFIRATNASFKLGIEFINWGELGERYIHPFGRLGNELYGLEFHQVWSYLKHKKNVENIDEYAVGALAGRNAKFNFPSSDADSVAGSYNYSYHFDAALYAQFLRKFAEQRRVKRVEGKVRDVYLDESGGIASVELYSGLKIAGDFFIDCTGFQGLLITKALGVEFEDWSEWLLCDRAVAVPCVSSADFLPLTRATAHRAGWNWRIPLQHRTGNGCVYSSQFMSEDEAVGLLYGSLDGERMAEPKTFKFTAGQRKQNWKKNCVAIGLSSGFLEPLESTSIYLIQFAIQKLIELFPNGLNGELLAEEFNQQLSDEYVRIRDFIILHYYENRRTDSLFWKQCAAMTPPQSLNYRQKAFRERGYVDYNQYGVYAAVCIGQGIIPSESNSQLRAFSDDQLVAFVKAVKQEIDVHVNGMPTMKSVLEQIKNMPK